MKTLTLLLQFIILYSLSAFCQTSESKQRLDTLIVKSWSANEEQWVVDSKKELSYSSDELIYQIITSLKEENSDDFIFSNKAEYTYNDNGNMAKELYQDWDISSNLWQNSYKGEYNYSEEGNCISEVFSDFYSEWITSYKFEYSYNNEGQRILELDYNWEENQWVVYAKEDLTYDINGKLVNKYGYYWDNSTSQWATSYCFSFNYDENDNIKQFIYQIWDEDSSNWVNNLKYEYTYDLTIYESSIICPPLGWFAPVSSNYELINKPLEFIMHKWDISSANWVSSKKGSYYYSKDEELSINMTADKKLLIYPNPVVDYINFVLLDKYEFVLFELFDIHGRKIISKKIEDNDIIDLCALRKGLYIYTIFMNGKIEKGKLLKE
ncbi:T9SS type A sorting domain-containing protein [Carboxylicivirga caseinilyticus]|uniref:T9SS type A sorting domain-containing protein n=1 Tax=Carboxylicivirga caseinilyticus TaxID=3417572 RepID=UPI003D3469E1|nr:T9SS type A sorting domain-containing protein [Marinilabiliaceae bacterium A049]